MSAHHGHSHDHADGHDHHDHAAHAGTKRLGIAAALTGLFMLAEIVGGLISGSLALLADAGHMFVDFAGLVLAFAAARLALRPADARRSYGYDRFQILVAYSNGLVLFGITAVIIYEAWRRYAEPVEILAGPMLVVAIGGLLVNIAAFFVLHGGDKEDLNMRGALLHVLGDLLGSVAAIVASLVIMATGWTQIDPILSVLVCLLILTNAWRLVRESAHVLLEGAPAGVDGTEVGRRLRERVAGVEDVHHVHVWMITPRRRAATLHVCVPEDTEGTDVVRRVKAELSTAFSIDHATVELEHGRCADADSECGSGHAHDHHDHAGPGKHHDHAHAHGHDHHDHAREHRHSHDPLPRPA
ncbi:cation diffusion facilitator family transporter [Aureimonas sp. AU22]|uniref:cation diffusion facilitator family transporter n=1 Tax=Aureimonas sp. AU22 TaxID=1638162 RepID=UPI0009E6BCD3|nr:cation diffusion facilitator family transporter [Aureimonas sp. AU22]